MGLGLGGLQGVSIPVINAVLLTGAQTVAGVKSFSDIIEAVAGVRFSSIANATITSNGTVMEMGNTVMPARAMYFIGSGATTAFYATGGGAYSASNTAKLWSENAAAAGDIAVKTGAYGADGSTNVECRLESWRTGLGGTEAEKATVKASGRIDQAGSDSSATPGNATINKPSGISAIANLATTCTITNSLVPAVATKRIRIMVSWHADSGATNSWAVQTAGGGSFVVTVTPAATADTIFSWEIAELL